MHNSVSMPSLPVGRTSKQKNVKYNTRSMPKLPPIKIPIDNKRDSFYMPMIESKSKMSNSKHNFMDTALNLSNISFENTTAI